MCYLNTACQNFSAEAVVWNEGQFEMQNPRKDDLSERLYFRSERVFQHNEQWYFYTREDESRGPFLNRGICVAHLDAYVSVMRSTIAPEKDLELARLDKY